MQKYLISFICFNILSMPAFALINDDFVDSTLDKTKPYPAHIIKNITDDFADNNLKNIPLTKREKPIIIDEFAENNNSKNTSLNQRIIINEVLPKSNYKSLVYGKKEAVIDKIGMTPVQIRIKAKITSKFIKIDEGDYVEFETVKPVVINKKEYPAGTTVKGRVETISPNDMRGTPGDIVISNFEIDGIKMYGELAKTGANRTLWLYPTSIVFSAFFGLGVLLLFIRGGHAKITPAQVFTVYVK